MKKSIIIFSGYNQRAVIAFLRTLASTTVQYAIIAYSKDDPIFLTAYARNVLAVREEKALALSDIIRSIKTVKESLKSNKYVIAPSTESLNRFLLQNRKELEENDCEIPLVDESLYESISDKFKFNEICVRGNILVPQEYKRIEEARIPYVVKPIKYRAENDGTNSPLLILEKKDHNLFIEQYKSEEFYFQEFLNGDSFYLLYYFHRDGSISKLSQQNYMQQPRGKSIIAAQSSDFHKTNESLKYEKLFKSLNFFGLVMVEVKRKEGANYMIEANPRFWGPSQLFVDAGINLFNSFLYDFSLIDEKPSPRELSKKIKYFWFGGFVQTLVSNGRITYHSYTSDQYATHLPEWLSADIYNRDDTRELFKQEVKI